MSKIRVEPIDDPEEHYVGMDVECFGGAADGRICPIVHAGMTRWSGDPYVAMFKYKAPWDDAPEIVLVCVKGLPTHGAF